MLPIMIVKDFQTQEVIAQVINFVDKIGGKAALKPESKFLGKDVPIL